MAYNNFDSVGIVLSTALAFYIITKIWKVLYIFYIGPAIIKVDVKSYGKWALITGCTDGIGKEYAKQMAARGCDIILVSRSLEKLNIVAKELENEFGVQTKVIQIDFGGDVSIYKKLDKEIEGLEIGTLINNVGISYACPEYFLDIKDWDSFLTNVVNVNVVSMIRLTGLVLPQMVKRGKGIVINLSSIAYCIPSPMLSVYAGTKAFVTKFTEGLRQEYADKGILFQCIAPGVVSTKMSHNIRTPFLAPDAETYVKSTIGLLGVTDNTHGFLPHSIFAFILNALDSISEKISVAISTHLLTKIKLEVLAKQRAER